MKSFTLSLVICFHCLIVFSQDSVSISNTFISRTFYFNKSGQGFYTSSFKNIKTGDDYARPGSIEFSLNIDTFLINGKNSRYLDHSITRSADAQILDVELQPATVNATIKISYEIYDSLPVIRKRLTITNHHNKPIALTNTDVENLQFELVTPFVNEVYAHYGTHLSRIPYKGDFNDAAVLLYHPELQHGVIFGNEAPSVLKRTELYRAPQNIAMGVTHTSDQYPFKKWLAPGATFSYPATFIYFSRQRSWQYCFEGLYIAYR